MLKVDHVSKIYSTGTFGGKELRAVNDVTFIVGHGEVVSLIGESGSGKSTIGKMILRLLPISSGTIIVDGVDISTLEKGGLKEYYRKVQGVFQDPFSSYNPIFKADRVFELIKDEFFPDVNKDEWRARVEKALRDVGLNPDIVLGKYPHQLSGGQLQRILIARALLLNIDLLIADEIISMLDASTRIDVLNLLAELKESAGLSILFITHDLSLGYYISERAVILYGGEIMEMGTTDSVFFNPQHPYTQMLMACIPRLDQEWEEVNVELKAKQQTLEAGCVYFGRCALADKSLGCDSRRPKLVDVEDGHAVACFAVEKKYSLGQWSTQTGQPSFADPLKADD
jgi:peptide/nickel transport system ATP-binding protein